MALALAVMPMAILANVDAPAQEYRGGENARALIVQRIDESKLVTPSGIAHPAAIAANGRRGVSDRFPMEHMQPVLRRPQELEKELEQLIDDQQRKGSPNYHKWLSAQEFGKRFGVSPQDIEKLSAWLQHQAFRVDSVLPSGMAI